MYLNIAPLRSAWIFLFNESSFAQNWFRIRELCPFHPSAVICPDEFQNTQRPMFLPYLLVRVLKFIDLECVRMGIWWSFWISTFCFLYSSEHVLKLMKTAACFRTLEMLTNLIFFLWSRIHGNALSCLQNNSSAQSTPKVMVGSRENCQQTYHS